MTNTPVVSMNQVTKSYGSLTAVNNLSCELAPGEVLGLFGHNGAGKTTMMKLILGITSPTNGRVDVLGAKPDSKAAWHIRSQVGYLPENVSFYEHLTGIEVLNYFAKLKGFNKQHAKDLIAQVGLTEAMNRAVKTYSKGMRQRLGLAQAFLGKPKLLLLDEPTVGLDPVATTEFYQQVDNLKAHGTSIILCSHVLPGVERHIDRAIILSKGQQLACGNLASLRAHANLDIRIKTRGVSPSELVNDSQLMTHVELCHDTDLLVKDENKMNVLRELVKYRHLDDIHIEQPDLNQVYQQILSQAPQKGSI
ncbi:MULTISPECIES: ABC transporter ATP-binding protein [Pseudoalteromonas]|jgi:Cu-processing system ATP-binding protein|uniref:ABC transporter ATP-binding protein n=1 Tax=Pseudoalteromonas TaxID=53246 RepID=UPI00094F7A20|nr:MULTISPECIES: ABC transporter ATP-binding protein [Pseudoalteromonas]MCC9661272.1 ABC transporter ATP-binding protein [Pseudoalteromonas sp. MB41]|tara:strand:+ start:2429 stop:3349 length:921 start_codon:yes stop_codon:yes gene_type:complete